MFCIEIHSNKCFYNLHSQKELIFDDDKVVPMYKCNCQLSKLRKCMLKSEALKKALPEATLTQLTEITSEAEDLLEATSRSVMRAREMIVTVIKLQEQYPPTRNQTACLYLERILYCLKVIC